MRHAVAGRGRPWATGLGLCLGLVALPSAQAALVAEVFADRAAFEARLGGAVAVIDFDDVDTATVDPAPFAADRWAATLGAVVTGEGGQYASRDFTFPSDFTPESLPNGYAPGPMGFGPSDPGGNETDVTFVGASGAPRVVAGFGAVFIDTDFPTYGPSSLAVFGTGGVPLGGADLGSNPNGSRVFRGIVIVDDGTDMPADAIARVHLVNGSEWPPRDIDEGVVLDDFVFPALPSATSTTTTTLPPACPVAPTFASIDCRLGVLLADVEASSTLGRQQGGLLKAGTAARARLQRAESLVAERRSRPTRSQLEKAIGKMKGFLRKLRSRRARRGVPAEVREPFLARGKALLADMKTLRASLSRRASSRSDRERRARSDR
jgi:hypothetical protein